MLDLLHAIIRGFKAVDAKLVSFFFDPPEKRDCCPMCGGTDLFDGYGFCQSCDNI